MQIYAFKMSPSKYWTISPMLFSAQSAFALLSVIAEDKIWLQLIVGHSAILYLVFKFLSPDKKLQVTPFNLESSALKSLSWEQNA